MFKIQTVSITGFWHGHNLSVNFNDDVNVIIGRNGTGKTTFMNILYSVLAVDFDGLYENDFESVTIRLGDGKSRRTVSAVKKEQVDLPFTSIDYHISNKRHHIRVIGSEEARAVSPSYRRRATEEAAAVRAALSEFASLASLSVYRARSDAEIDPRERPRRMSNPVDTRLSELMQRLTHYQLELSVAARRVSSELQRKVLFSLLYDPTTARGSYTLVFDEHSERENLRSAYLQLGLTGSEVTRRIQEHVKSIGKSVIAARQIANEEHHVGTPSIDFAPLEAMNRARAVVDMSLMAESETKVIFQQVDVFLSTLRGFISDKTFSFEGGDLRVALGSSDELLLPSKLSSGEKQLLILLIEALLQNKRPYIFLADEPELSLHIAWQRKILVAVRELNPNAQIIVATHSPEIAGKFRQSIIDMGDILHAAA